jgi:hypothetical protein
MARAGRIETYRFDRRDGKTVFALWSQLQSAKQRLNFKQPIRNVEIFDRMTTLVAQSGKEGLSALPLGEQSRFLVVHGGRVRGGAPRHGGLSCRAAEKLSVPALRAKPNPSQGRQEADPSGMMLRTTAG